MANEKRLIDANALYKQISERYDLDYGEILIDPYWFADMVDDATTVDAVEVVRCKDCKWHCEYEGECVCDHVQWQDAEGWLRYVEGNGFCHLGERGSSE